ncbi:MAG: hypothetical protein IBJ11_09000 [Phycisphaerales bacterium]|nr:hypothetical protein [Phycisphaerales bacterium]
MSRARALAAAAILAAAPAPLGAAPETPDQTVEQYLLDLGLRDVLADRLEARLKSATGNEKTDVAQRLAGLYAELLEKAEDPAAQQNWESRAQALMASVPAAATLELRLNLARAAYTRAEKLGERARLRLLAEAESAPVARRFEDLRERFRAIATEANGRVAQLEHVEENAREADPDLLAGALAGARRARSMAHYLAGWSSLYLAQLTARPEPAGDAIRSFGWLLGASPNQQPQVERLSRDNLQLPHVARAAIAVALAHGLLKDTGRALAWLDAVDSAPKLAPGIDDLLGPARVQILASAARWADLESLIAKRRAPQPAAAGERPLPAPDARILALLALEAQPASDSDRAAAERLRDIALSDLVARDELGHVLDLAARFGPERLGTRGFVALNVRALVVYNDARRRHEPTDRPTADPEIAKAFSAAAGAFRLALEADDAAKFPAAASSATMLLGLSLFYAGDDGSADPPLLAASRAFENAASSGDNPARAAEALWMAAQAVELHIDNLAKASRPADPALAARRDALLRDYLKRFPAAERAPAALIRLAAVGGMPAPEALEALLRVPESHRLHDTARRQAAQLAFQLFRAAGSAADRDFQGARFLDLAETLLALDRRRAALAPAGEAPPIAELAASRARRILEVALSLSVPDLSRADRAVDSLLALRAGGLLDTAPFAAELDYRRAQIALARGEDERAAELVRSVAESDSRFAGAAARLFYRHHLAVWQRASAQDPTGERTLASARLVTDFGRRVLAQLTPAGSAPSALDPGVASVHLSVADAAYALWQASAGGADTPSRDLAREHYRVILAAQPNNGHALRRAAELAEAARDTGNALAHWRMLSAGLPPGDAAFFEVRYRLIRLMADAEPDNAREALAQHRALFPNFGPDPWGPKIRELDDRLGPVRGRPAASGSAPAPNGGGPR